jgi:cyanophycin synthetase
MKKILLTKRDYPKIAVTGTKGKTTIVRLLEAAYRGVFDDILRVDTSGAYVNCICQTDEGESRKRWGFTPTNAPGRFLGLLDEKRRNLALLECTVYNAVTGLAYKEHEVGLFTNVFEDHIGSTDLLKDRQDIADNKSFIFSNIADGGVAIYNADDDLVISQLTKTSKTVSKFGVSIKTMGPDRCYVDAERVVITKGSKAILSLLTREFTWVVPGFVPMQYAVGFVVATLYATLNEQDFVSAIDCLKKYKFDKNGGRMIFTRVQNGPKVILDFAHEKYSLAEIAKLAHSMTGPTGKVIGVLRLAPSRTDQLINNTADYISDLYDKYIIYDKVDGHWRLPKQIKGIKGKNEEVGLVAKKFSRALAAKVGKENVNAVIREDLAIVKAIRESSKNDVIIYIVNDNSTRSLEFLNAAAKDNGFKGVKIL